jgi:hypothetical protein
VIRFVGADFFVPRIAASWPSPSFGHLPQPPDSAFPGIGPILRYQS